MWLLDAMCMYVFNVKFVNHLVMENINKFVLFASKLQLDSMALCGVYDDMNWRMLWRCWYVWQGVSHIPHFKKNQLNLVLILFISWLYGDGGMCWNGTRCMCLKCNACNARELKRPYELVGQN